MLTIIFYLAILYAIAAGWRLYLEYKKHLARQHKSNEARSWPSVIGQVVSTTIIKSAVPRTPIFTTGYAGLGVGINRGVSSNRLRYIYQPNVDYIYLVDGTQYDGNCISLSDDLLSKKRICCACHTSAISRRIIG